MALIQCPECGKEVSNQAKKCPYCGYKINKKIRTAGQPQNNKPKIALIIVIGFLILSICGAGGYYGYEYWFIPMSHYNKAESYLKNNKYEKAIKEFKAAGKFKDAANRIKDTEYNLANKIGTSDLDKSIELYKKLGDYKDSKDKLSDLEKEKEKQDALNILQIVANQYESEGTSLSADKKSIIVDSTGEFDFVAMEDISLIIKILGLPDSLLDEMCYTNALMGRQRETYGYYEVSWSYHPDNGLDVIFKFIG